MVVERFEGTKKFVLILTKVEHGERDRFRSLEAPDTYYMIKPGDVGDRVAYSVEMAYEEYLVAVGDVEDPHVNLHVIEPAAKGFGGTPPGSSVTAYVDASGADAAGLTGSGVAVCVIDNGVGPGLRDGYLAGKIKDAASFDPLRSSPYELSDSQTEHGSNMSSLAAPSQAQIVIATTGYWNDQITAAIYWAVDEVGVDVISMSFYTGPLTALDEAIAYADAQGVVMFACAGNGGLDNSGDGENVIWYPASQPEVYAISNYRPSTDSISSSSNYHEKVWAACAGCEIEEYGPDGDSATNDDGGTSAATALTSGLFARLHSQHTSPSECLSLLANHARSTGAGAIYEGVGVLRLMAAHGISGDGGGSGGGGWSYR